jgi:class 3 adenylate cyclase
MSAMSTFMDRHIVPGVTLGAVADAHLKDLETQDALGVRFLTYWVDESRDSVFCLAEAPSAEAVSEVHRKAHGLVPNDVVEVDPRTVTSFLGAIIEPEPGTPWAASAFRTIMITDIVGSTSLIGALGDIGAKELVLEIDVIVRQHVERHSGRTVDHTGDGVMSSFASAHDALRCAVALQRAVAAREGTKPSAQIRVGLAAGEPIAEANRLFGAAVNLAARMCAAADPATICAPSSVRELAMGKGFQFVDRCPATMKGFPDPVQVFEVAWSDDATAPPSDPAAANSPDS